MNDKTAEPIGLKLYVGHDSREGLDLVLILTI